MVRNISVPQETQVQPLGREDPLEKEMAIHFSVLAWRIPWTEEPGGLHSQRDCKESNMTELLHSVVNLVILYRNDIFYGTVLLMLGEDCYLFG